MQLMVTVQAGNGAADRLAAALAAAEIAAVAIEPGPLRADALMPLVQSARSAGAAVVLCGEAVDARRAGADGILAGGDAVADDDDAAALVAAARAVLGRDGAIGVDTAGSRHRAMVAAEAGADYVAFGIDPALSVAEGEDAARDARRDLIAWWGEIFEPACVALDVASPEEAEALAEAGADLVDVRLGPGTSPSAVAECVRAFAAAIARGRGNRTPEDKP